MFPSEPPNVDDLHRRSLARLGSTVAGKWRLERLLGVGGTAAVYAARHRNGKQVAVKILHASLAPNPDAVERFLDEAHAANRVGHAGVVSVLDDATTDDGCAVLVMELLEGETLDARLAAAGKGLDVLEVLFVAEQLLDVLCAAHERGILHRDIKPENVFLTRSGAVKLLDFGIARLTETRRTLRTQTGATMGTPAFMAPEQARGRWDDIDARTDLWSVGATLFVALSGRLVHEAETLNEELLSAMTRSAPRLSSVLPGVPSAVAAIVDRALAFERGQRYTDAREMQAAVHSAFLELGGESYEFTRRARPDWGRSSFAPNASPTTHRPVTSSGGVRSLATERARPKQVLAALLVALALVALGSLGFSARSGSTPELARGLAPPLDALVQRPASRSPPAPPVEAPPAARSAEPEPERRAAPLKRRARPEPAPPQSSQAPVASVAPPPAPPPSATSEPFDPLSRRK